MTVPIAFSNSSLILSRCTHGGSVLIKGSPRNESDGRAEVIDIEFEFFLFVSGIKRSGDRSLPGCGKKSDDELIGIW